jgi:hypothetical protein
MRIKLADGSTATTSDNRNLLRLSDLAPGSVFSYQNGADHNVYILLELSGQPMLAHLNSSRIFQASDISMASPVIWHKEADLDIGTIQIDLLSSLSEEENAAIHEQRDRPKETDKFDDLDSYDFYSDHW